MCADIVTDFNPKKRKERRVGNLLRMRNSKEFNLKQAYKAYYVITMYN